MNLCFAFAVNEANQFGKKHFRDADKYLIYKQDGDEIKLFSEEINIFKTFDKEVEHGSKKKGNAIINFLKEKGVSVLVSKQFGRNIKMVNQHFVPVIIAEDEPENAVEVLQKHMNWFEDELQNRKENYMLFHIKNGILKMHIKKD